MNTEKINGYVVITVDETFAVAHYGSQVVQTGTPDEVRAYCAPEATPAPPAVPAAPAPVVPLGDWMRNPDAFDPSAIMRTVEADGTLYTLHSVMGEGWPVCIRKSGYGHVGMADWNDMAGVRRAIDTHNAKQA